ncbi:MAG: hypothetical protein ACE5GN_05465, partial [Waddliaceae bacterium]
MYKTKGESITYSPSASNLNFQRIFCFVLPHKAWKTHQFVYDGDRLTSGRHSYLPSKSTLRLVSLAQGEQERTMNF